MMIMTILVKRDDVSSVTAGHGRQRGRRVDTKYLSHRDGAHLRPKVLYLLRKH